MLLGVVGNPPGRSESATLFEIKTKLEDVQRRLQESEYGRAGEVTYVMTPGDSMRMFSELQGALNLVNALRRQVDRGFHVNGRRARGGKMSDNVMAIVYVHAADGQRYVHAFGDADVEPRTRGNALVLEGLKERTGVQMFADPDGGISVVHRDGKPVWEDV